MNSKVIILALAAAAAFACTTEVVLEPEDTSVKVIMNAQLKTSQDGAMIYLSASKVSETERLAGATVTVSVNGGAPVTALEQAEESDGYYGYQKYIAYYYDGSFKAGDNVVFEAKTKYGNVKSEITVPEKVNMAQVDTLRTLIKGSGYTEVNMQFKIKINDKPGVSNFYRLTFFKEECYDNGQGEGKQRYYITLPADGSSDPVLSEGTLNTGDLLSELLEMDNSYLIFNDNTFEGESRTLRVNVNMYNLLASFSFYYGTTTDYDPGYMYVVLEHLSFEEYYYLKAMTNMDNLGYDASFFFEPTTIPSNVEDGLGFVSVSTCSDPVKFRIPDDIYLYEIRYQQEHPEENPYY